MRTTAAAHQKSDLVWECVKKNNCFIKKFNGVTLSRDPLNLVGIHCKKYTGLSGNSVGLEIAQRKVYLVKRNGKSRNPAKNVEKLRVGNDKATSMPRAVKFVGETRPDLIPVVDECLTVLAKQNRSA